MRSPNTHWQQRRTAADLLVRRTPLQANRQNGKTEQRSVRLTKNTARPTKLLLSKCDVELCADAKPSQFSVAFNDTAPTCAHTSRSKRSASY